MDSLCSHCGHIVQNNQVEWLGYHDIIETLFYAKYPRNISYMDMYYYRSMALKKE